MKSSVLILEVDSGNGEANFFLYYFLYYYSTFFYNLPFII